MSAPTGSLASALVAFALVLAPPLGLYARVVAIGEVSPLGSAGSAALHGTITRAGEGDYKLRAILARRPEVLVIGSSRVLGIRQEHFTACASSTCFYNAGGEKPTLRYAADLFARVAERAPPRLLLLAVDPWDFIPAYVPSDAGGKHVPADIERGPWEHLKTSFAAARLAVAESWGDPDARALLLGLRPIAPGREGLNAQLRSAGYRPDGSFRWPDDLYGRVSQMDPDERVRPLVRDIEGAGRPFLPFDRADAETVRELTGILRTAHRSRTQVVVLVPPFPAPAERALRSSAVLAPGLADARRQVADAAAAEGTSFFEPGIEEAGCRTDMFWDPLHASEECAARLVLWLADRSPAVRAYVDRAALAERITSAPDPLGHGRP